MIQELFKKFKEKKLKKRVFKRYMLHFEERLETELLNEKWIIKRILDGQTERRKELSAKQAEIKELQLIVTYFKSI